MGDHSRGYRWYLTGCSRYGYTPIGEDAFAIRWSEFQQYAERLKQAESAGSLESLDADARAAMQQSVQDDPFVKAILVGIAADDTAGE